MCQAPTQPFLMDVKKCGYSTGCTGGSCSCLGDGAPCTSKRTCKDCKNPNNIFNISKEDLYDTGSEDDSEE